jgi:hypothetical protein
MCCCLQNRHNKRVMAKIVQTKELSGDIPL